jgi:hypothetical protein
LETQFVPEESNMIDGIVEMDTPSPTLAEVPVVVPSETRVATGKKEARWWYFKRNYGEKGRIEPVARQSNNIYLFWFKVSPGVGHREPTVFGKFTQWITFRVLS